MVDKLTNAETVVFNRAAQNPDGTPDVDQALFHKIVRASNRSAEIIYEFENGDMVYDDIADRSPSTKPPRSLRLPTAITRSFTAICRKIWNHMPKKP